MCGTDLALRFVNELNKGIYQRAARVEPMLAVATRPGWRTLRDWRSSRAVVGSAIHTQRHSQSNLVQILKIALRGGMLCEFLATTPGVLSAIPIVVVVPGLFNVCLYVRFTSLAAH